MDIEVDGGVGIPTIEAAAQVSKDTVTTQLFISRNYKQSDPINESQGIEIIIKMVTSLSLVLKFVMGLLSTKIGAWDALFCL